MSKMKNIDTTVYVFDVDGVLCDIGQDINPDVVQWLARLLDSPAFVAINTGRGYDRIGGEVVALLRECLQNSASLDRLLVSTEMGGVITKFDDGQESQQYTEYSMSQELKQRAVDVYFASGSDTIMSNYIKQSMATFVKLSEVSQEDFERQKSELVERLRGALDGEDVTIATTAESVDVYARTAGKQAGAKLIMEWVKSVSDIHHDTFVCFGDSTSDYEMVRYFATQDADTTFVFTGENLSVDEHDHVKVVDTVGRYTAGTLEYLSRVSKEL